MEEPYHRELYDILIKKGWDYLRVEGYVTPNYDHYYDKFNNREIIFYEDDTLVAYEGNRKMKFEDLDQITNHIFAGGNNGI